MTNVALSNIESILGCILIALICIFVRLGSIHKTMRGPT